MAALLLAVLLFFAPATADIDADGAALQRFRRAVGGGDLGWSSSSSPCTWRGVACKSGRVSELRLPGAGLRGEIPDGSIGNLTRLITLSLRYNRLSGSLPPDLTSLVHLQNLYLQNNLVSGQIPSSISSLGNLVRLNLAGNAFSGEIPDGILFLNRLRSLSLENNRLSGEIPEFSVTFEQFNVSYNNLSGEIPLSLRGMPPSAFLGLNVCGLSSNPCPDDGIAPPPPFRISENNRLSAGAIAGIVVACVVGLFLLFFLLFFLLRRGKKHSRTISAEVVNLEPDPHIESSSIVRDLVFLGSYARDFDLDEPLDASAEVLGKGTFGYTYLADLDGGPVVVKRRTGLNLPEQEFRRGVTALGAMAHPNVVPLRAYSWSRYEQLIIYNFLPGGSLFSLLHPESGLEQEPLPWHNRVEIATDVAHGLEYIHSRGPFSSHGNIRSSNVLFAASGFPAMVSDHGLLHLCGNAPPCHTGYQAPEETNLPSQAGDVFSFGVLLLELLTGKAPAQARVNEETVELPHWVRSIPEDAWPSQVFDPKLGPNIEEEKVILLLQLAIDCTSPHTTVRPSILDVVIRMQHLRRIS